MKKFLFLGLVILICGLFSACVIDCPDCQAVDCEINCCIDQEGFSANNLHAALDGRCLFLTDQYGVTEELFCLPTSEYIYGIGYESGSVFLAINRGPITTIQERDLAGNILATFTVDINLGPNNTIYDMAADQTGFWTAKSNSVSHYEWATLQSTDLVLPEGYHRSYGVAYNQPENHVYVLLSDETGLDRNCPALGIYDFQGDPTVIPLPIGCFDVAFGLGYDEQTNSLWLIHSTFDQTRSNWLMNISLNGDVLDEITIDHDYGSVETIQLPY